MSKRLNSLKNEFGCAYLVIIVIFVMVMIMKEGEGAVGLTVSLIVVSAVIFYSHQTKKRSKAKKRNYGFLFDKSEASETYLKLVSEVLRIDDNSAEKEKKYLNEVLSHYFKEKKVAYLTEIIENNLKNPPTDIKAHCAGILKEFDVHSIVQLMHLLVGICVSDAFLTLKENKILREIAVNLRLPFSTYNQILLMYRFKYEGAKQKKRKSSFSSKSQLISAYGILELTQDASIEEIKKSYRSLALLHHPDKVIHLGEEMQVVAKEKFQIISEAYELIKETRKFA